jgi:hypothetical protein
MARRPKLRLVGAPDPADIFDDLTALRREQRARGPQRRPRATETFARIPHDQARALYPRLGSPAWALLIELDRLIFKGRGRNPVKLTSEALRGSGLTRWQVERGLHRLERAGAITVERKRGRCPFATLLWYPPGG